MLEQPPEKSELEIAAELAAMQEPKDVLPNRALKFLQLVIWCSPLVACFMIANGFYWLAMKIFLRRDEAMIFILFLTTCLINTYGIGCYDGILSHKTRLSLVYTRSGNIYLHALKFVAWQILFMPSLLFIFSLISIGFIVIIAAVRKIVSVTFEIILP